VRGMIVFILMMRVAGCECKGVIPHILVKGVMTPYIDKGCGYSHTRDEVDCRVDLY
jgi:hypothetical protein